MQLLPVSNYLRASTTAVDASLTIHSWNGDGCNRYLVMSPNKVRARLKEVKAIVRNTKCIGVCL